MNYNEESYSFDDKPKRKREEDPTTWADAFKALGIFSGVIFIFGIIGNILNALLLADTMDGYYKILGTASTSNPFLDSVEAIRNPVYMILYMLIGVIFLVIGLLVLYSLMHFFATKIFKGEGTLRGLIVRGNVWTTGSYLAVSIALSLQSYILVNTIVNQFQGVNLSTSSYVELQQFNDAIMSVMTPMLLIYGITWLVWGIAMSNITGKNYALTTGKGCASMILMNVSLFVLFCGCSFILGMVASSLLTVSY